MNKMMKIIITCLMLIIIFSIGSVSAEEIVNSDFTGVSQISGEVAAVEDNQIINDVNQEIVYSNYSNNEKSQVPISSGEVGENLRENLLGLSLDEENALQYGNIKNFSGDHFRDLRNAIGEAKDGDTIDLEGKTIIADSIGGNSKLFTDKHLTFINGVINSANVTNITAEMRSEFYNCIFENVTFINYREAYEYGMIISDCELRHVTFQNFTVNVAGFVVRRCNLTDVNFTECHSLLEEDEDDYETGAMIVAYNSNFDNCNFVNCTTNRHSGAICIAGENGNAVNITNSNFINCRAGIGGAIYVHGNEAINENFHSNIINCTFINNTATERGGAIGSSQNYLVVENCLFENNTAKRGSAYMLAGISHGLDGIPEGHYNSIINSTFKNNVGTEEGGAVHITGNNNKAINCTFLDNYATEGNGSAIYVHGNNSSVIDSEFYHHECSRGTVYIIGDNTIIDNSIFENNTASRGGAGVYVDGNNTLISNSIFNNNSAVYHGGALHSHGDNLTITNSNFTSNTAIASTDDIEQGLGGAIFIKGDNSDISFSFFENNVARNGSAIYNRGENLTIEDDTFFENQAWSYLITGITNDKRFYYDPEANVTIDVTHRGGDNIINAIYNDGSPNNIFFKNVTYELSVNNRTNSGPDLVNPVDGVEKSEGGTLVYQDSREDNQNITIVVTHMESGKVVINVTSKTGILGNLTVSKKGLLPGNYSVNVTHIEDGLYKFITNMTYFEILPVADLAVEKLVSNKTCNLGDEIIWTIKVTNNGPNNVTDAYVIDKLPDGLIFNGADGKYDETTGRWDIGTLNVDDVKILAIKTIVNITNTTFVNVATINSSTYDPNQTNNVANNTTKSNSIADLSVVKLVSQKISVIGDTITWTIKVINNGPDTAVNAYAIDVLPSDIAYVSDDSNGKYNSNNGRWDIGNLKKGDSATLNIVTKITNDMTTIVNNVFVNSSTPDSNMTNNNASNDTRVLESNFIVEKNTITPIVSVGEQVKFQIVVRNTGLTNLTNVFVEEYSYDGLEFDHALNQSLWTHSIVDGKNRWTLNTPFVPGEVAGLIVVFNTTKVGNFTNVVVAGSDETENKTTNNTTKVVEGKLDVKKITINPVVLVGDQVTFEILVKNIGEVTLSNVFVEESYYTGLTYDSFVKNGYWTNSVVNGKNRWTLNTNLAPNEAIGLFVVFNTTKTGNFTNVVVAGSDETENKTTNNTTKVVGGKFDVQKITLTPIVHVGNQTSFEIVVRNVGEVVLHDVVLEETSYNGLIYDSFVNTPLWTHSVVNNKHIWTLNKALNLNEVASLIVNFNTTGVGNFTNVVTVNSNETGNKIANNTTIVYNETTPDPESNKTKNPNIEIVKVALDKVVIIGNQAVFEIIVTNTGNVVLYDVIVSEDSYNGLIYDSWYDYSGLWNENGQLKWAMNSPLYTGEVASFYVVFNTTTTGEFTNIVSVDSNETDKKSSNDTIEVIRPDFAVEKIVINRSVLVGEQVMFEIVVHNLGQVDLTNVVVREDIFTGLVYDSFIDHSGLWAKNGDLSWNLTTPLRAGEYEGFFVVFNTTAAGNFVNFVVADSNEIPNKTDNDTVEVLNPSLDVQKITINRTVNAGDQVMFEIVVHNTGKVILNDVTVRENSFDGLTYDSFIDYYGVWTKNGDLSWTLNAPLYAGEYLSLFVVFNTTKAGTFTNVVSASSDKTKDKPAQNTTTVIENPKTPMADLAIAKVVYATDGNKVTWGLYVVNNGPDKAVNARVIDVLPKTLQYLSSVVSKGYYDVNTGIWFIGDMENGEEAVMILETIALTTGLITNEANVTSDTFDPDMSNNYDNETVVINEVPETPKQPKVEPVNATPATGNPLIMVLLALIALGTGALRRRK